MLALVETFPDDVEASLSRARARIPHPRVLLVRVVDEETYRALMIYDKVQVWYHFHDSWRKTEDTCQDQAG